MNKKLLPYAKAKELLEEGDILLFESQGGIIGTLVSRAGEGKYSHVGMASGVGMNGKKLWECVEFREWKGGRSINLERYSKENNIDVYRVKPQNVLLSYNEEEGIIEQKTIEFNGKKVTNTMRLMTGLPYGWIRIFWIIQHKLPFLRFFYSMESVNMDDLAIEELVYPVCSSAVAYSYSKADFDLVYNRANKWTEPSDISRSTLLNYIFTIV